MKNVFNKTPGYLPKETFSQRGRLGLGGPVSQITVVLGEGFFGMERLPHSPNSATPETEGTPPHVTHPALCGHISVGDESYQKVSPHLD